MKRVLFIIVGLALVLIGFIAWCMRVELADRPRLEYNARAECLRMGGQALLSYNAATYEFHITGCKLGG